VAQAQQYIAAGYSIVGGQEAADKLRETVRSTVPLQVASTPEDVAEVVMFLAGPASRNVTGEITVADAGWLLAKR
jgi:NAD(P)-dependent dehydrogenase (short-subunit alcohol dehydrogenase family)